MKKTYKTIRLDQETYDLLHDYRMELEAVNRGRISLGEAINISFGEMAGLDYELTDEKLRYTRAHENCSCGATEEFVRREHKS